MNHALRSLAPAAATAGAAAFAVSGALQASGLDWDESRITGAAQHTTVAFWALALALVVLPTLEIGRRLGGRGSWAARAVAAGSLTVAVIGTISNVRGVDAGWFDAVAGASNLAWALGSIGLAVVLARRAVPRALVAAPVVAYLAAIPLGTLGGGLLAAALWLVAAHALAGRRSAAAAAPAAA